MHREDNASTVQRLTVQRRRLVAILMRYLKALLEDVPPGDIGLIAPYRKQVERINKALKIEFPRNTAEFKAPAETPDPPSSVGFLADPKRFNVAMTPRRSPVDRGGELRGADEGEHLEQFIEYSQRTLS
ncbi:unnamed protein product [Arctogadus glacialis]